MDFRVQFQKISVGQKVHSGLSIILWQSLNKLFDQPNIIVGLLFCFPTENISV